MANELDAVRALAKCRHRKLHEELLPDAVCARCGAVQLPGEKWKRPELVQAVVDVKMAKGRRERV